jgi:hypothetical protein
VGHKVVGGEILMLRDPDGSPVCNAAFDLSAAQLGAAAHALAEVRLERHRGEALELDGVLALRQLTSVGDELDHLTDAAGHTRMTMPLARMVLLHDALDEWVTSRVERGWLREADEEALPILEALLPPMGSLREEAVRQTLEAREAEAKGS